MTSFAEKMMAKAGSRFFSVVLCFAFLTFCQMGHVPGQGLGPEGKGIATPIEPVGNMWSHGLGYKPSRTRTKAVKVPVPQFNSDSDQDDAAPTSPPPETWEFEPVFFDPPLLEFFVIEDAIERAKSLVLQCSCSFPAIEDAERCVEGALEWNGFYYGIADYAPWIVTKRVRDQVHHELAIFGYDSGIYHLDIPPMVRKVS
ncbi:hypothetical protein K504DRAFT_508032 [Pleomassaria siparia CBS 279.74]|uniref:G-patch domain-containing protein n=1 Tax=Pleomassaria siparia CBS 279.74 TaxID=1314801 RepID=A0A6G1JS78_9PLEO|nr:hypothetical protein K504DRAFT_508032 [Pleomassaria siparia CBS 279.74]